MEHQHLSGDWKKEFREKLRKLTKNRTFTVDEMETLYVEALAAQHARFMEVLEGVVPEEIEVRRYKVPSSKGAHRMESSLFDEGHNACRTEVLQRIEAAKEKITGSGKGV